MAKMVRPPPKTRIRRSPEEARTHILEAAVRVISAHGPDAATLKDVATEAGVSHALVVHYFKTYDALVDAALDESMSQLRLGLLEGIRTSTDPSPEHLLGLYLDAAFEPWYGRMVSFALLSGRLSQARYAERIAPDVKRIADAVEGTLTARTKTPPSRAEVEALIVAAWSMAIGYVVGGAFFWRALGRTPGPERDVALRGAMTAIAESTLAAAGAGRTPAPSAARRRRPADQ
jgi:AcrR family transcriptional regulator